MNNNKPSGIGRDQNVCSSAPATLFCVRNRRFEPRVSFYHTGSALPEPISQKTTIHPQKKNYEQSTQLPHVPTCLSSCLAATQLLPTALNLRFAVGSLTSTCSLLTNLPERKKDKHTPSRQPHNVEHDVRERRKSASLTQLPPTRLAWYLTITKKLP